MTDFSIFDNSFDIIVVYDQKGVISYANSSFYLFSGLSPARVLGKLRIDKIFLNFDGKELSVQQFTDFVEPSSIRVVNFQTKNIENGLGQYSVLPIEEKFVFYFKDLTIEEDLHKKYRREMSLKDKKIEEMDSLIELLQNTRMVREARKIIEEFTKHVLNNMGIGIGFLKDQVGEIFKVINSNQIGPSTSYNFLIKTIVDLKPFTKYTVLNEEQIQTHFGVVSSQLNSLVVIPIGTYGKEYFEIFLPLHSEEKTEQFDHQKVITLSEQMKLLIQNMALEKLSIYDDLTKIHNSRFFREKLNSYTSQFQTLNLILMDIDYFKKVNDTYGHLGGDVVLIQVGQILKMHQEREILVSRVGGEEFAVLVPNQTLEETLDLASKISEQIKSTVIPFDGKSIQITMSFGISNWNPDKFSVRDFYKKADEALYESKTNGRDRITIFNCA